ncbi:MAG: DUF2294 domain-containing protein [Thermoleophilaceae bacterium]
MTRGEMAAEVSKGIVRLFGEYYGRGPVKAKTFLLDNYAMTVLEDTLTTAESTLAKAGRESLVRDFRIAFQAEMGGRFKAVVELATGRSVLTYQSQIMFDPDVCIEFFVLDGPPETGDHSGD